MVQHEIFQMRLNSDSLKLNCWNKAYFSYPLSARCMPHKTVTIPTLPAKNLLPHLQYPKPETEFSKYQNVIENNITEHHYYRVKRKSARLSDANVESPEQNCNKGKEKPVPPPLQIRRSSGINLIGRYQTAGEYVL